MKYLTIEDTKKIALKDCHEMLTIDEDRIIDFEWGNVFFFKLKHNSEENLTGLAGLLVDKIYGETQIINENKNIDSQIESYRLEKGYKHIIKFPPIKDLSKLSKLEKVFALFETEELFQIESALQLVRDDNLFSIDRFVEVCTKRKIENVKNIPVAISDHFNFTRRKFQIYNTDLKKIPNEISLFKEDLREIYIYDGESLKELPESIVELYNLETIHVELTPLKVIPRDLKKLKKLKTIKFYNTQIEPGEKKEFILPNNCKIEIEKSINWP